MVTEPFVDWAPRQRIRSQSRYQYFELFPWQEKLAEIIENHSRIMLFKVRQVGATEMILAYLLWQALQNPAYSAVVFSIGQRESIRSQSRVKLLSPDINFEINSKTELQLSTGARLAFLPSTEKGSRSLESVSTIFIDECGFISTIEELYPASVASQSMAGPDAKLILASTMPTDGALSWFWQTFIQGTPGGINVKSRIEALRSGENPEGFDYWVDDSGWAKVLVHWRAHPIYGSDPYYIENTGRALKLPLEALLREYDLAFPTAGATLFNEEAVYRQATGSWTAPTAGRRYLVGVDPNFGGNDYFVVLVIDCTEPTVSLVAEFAENNRSSSYCQGKLAEIIKTYRPLVVSIETNSGGIIIAEQLIKAFPHVALEGVTTTRNSKIVNTDRVAIAVEQGLITYPKDWAGISEMLNFSAQKREAVQGHDDRVMALAVALANAKKALPRSVGQGQVWF